MTELPKPVIVKVLLPALKLNTSELRVTTSVLAPLVTVNTVNGVAVPELKLFIFTQFEQLNPAKMPVEGPAEPGLTKAIEVAV